MARRLLLAALFVGSLSAPSVSAQTSFGGLAKWTHVPAFTPLSVHWNPFYIDFVVSVGGTFTFETFGMNFIDPDAGLWCVGSGPCGIGQQTYGGFGATCDEPWQTVGGWGDDDCGTRSGDFWNSKMVGYLGAGSYRASAGALFWTSSCWYPDPPWELDVDPFPWGAAVPDECSYTWSLTSADGVASRVATVPEPGSLLLLATGVLGMAFVRRRRV